MRPAIAGTSTSAPERPATFIEAPARISTPAATEKPILMANDARSVIALRNSKSGYHGLRLGKHVALLNSAPASMTVSELLRIADHLDRKDQEIVRRAYERAHARPAARGQAPKDLTRDARYLRATGAPARHRADQVGARGPRVPQPRARRLRGRGEADRAQASRARAAGDRPE